jgi:hypothetical protein
VTVLREAFFLADRNFETADFARAIVVVLKLILSPIVAEKIPETVESVRYTTYCIGGEHKAKMVG